MGHESVVAVGAQTRRELDEEVRGIIDRQYAMAKDIILANRDKLERIANALLEHETLDLPQVKTLMDGGELPPRRSTVVVAKVDTDLAKDKDAKPELAGPATPALEPKLA
jgi:cell division protease FtsH